MNGHLPTYEMTSDGKCVVWCDCGWPGGDDPDVWARRLEPEKAVAAYNAHLDSMSLSHGPLVAASLAIVGFASLVVGFVAGYLVGRWR